MDTIHIEIDMTPPFALDLPRQALVLTELSVVISYQKSVKSWHTVIKKILN
jgi:hypothetical protein